MASKPYKRSGSPFYYIKYYEHGKQVFYNTKTSSLAEAKLVLSQIVHPKEMNSRHHKNMFQVNVTLMAALKEFRDNYLILSDIPTKQKGLKSIYRDRRNIMNFEEYLHTKNITEYNQISADVLKDYIQVHCIGKQPNTITKELRLVKKFYLWSLEKGFCVDNPSAAMRNPKPAPKAPRFFSEEELQKFFDAAKEPYNTMCKILYLTGLRIGELCNLELQDYIQHTKQLIIRVKVGNKTKRETIVPLNRSAHEILERVLKERDGKSTYIFFNGNGDKHKGNVVADCIKRVLVRNGILNASVHCFRHTFASHLAIKNVSLYIISKLLRHKSIKETEIYAHLSNESERNAIELLNVDL